MANEKRLIDANFTKATIQDYIANNEVTEAFVEIAGHICDMLDDCETVDVEEEAHGYWIERPLDNFRKYEVKCSECGWTGIENYDSYVDPSNFNYCPNCGAYMMDGDGNA